MLRLNRNHTTNLIGLALLSSRYAVTGSRLLKPGQVFRDLQDHINFNIPAN